MFLILQFTKKNEKMKKKTQTYTKTNTQIVFTPVFYY